MNKLEKMLAERMTFTSRRGRTADYQKTEWLRNLRKERRYDERPSWTIFCHPIGWVNVRGSIRAAKIEAKKIEREFPGEPVRVNHTETMISVWDNVR